MNVADRIQSLRKGKGISQEELADKIGVSRQAVSKWESEQSLPDIEKIILLSDYFDVTTDYLLKGIEPAPESLVEKPDARIFSAVGSALNFMGLIAAVFIWIEKQLSISVAIGLIIMAMGCMIFATGQFTGENKKQAAVLFSIINVWFLSLIPISCIFNCVQGIVGRHWWTFSPIPQLGNSLVTYAFGWFVYLGFCILTDIIICVKREKSRWIS